MSSGHASIITQVRYEETTAIAFWTTSCALRVFWGELELGFCSQCAVLFCHCLAVTTNAWYNMNSEIIYLGTRSPALLFFIQIFAWKPNTVFQALLSENSYWLSKEVISHWMEISVANLLYNKALQNWLLLTFHTFK